MTVLSVMLAKVQEPGKVRKNDQSKYAMPPIEWLAAEKYDGYRALFLYEETPEGLKGVFYSRQGKIFEGVPEWFLKSMPHPNVLGDKILDGELWAGRNNFQKMGVVRTKNPDGEKWARNNIRYCVYDITNMDDTFIARTKKLKDIVNFTNKAWGILVRRKDIVLPKSIIDSSVLVKESPLVFTKQVRIKSIEQMKEMYQNILQQGGEGLMIKHPESYYKNGRSDDMLKVKPSFDREAIIIDYRLGEGKYKGMLGSFICRPLINHDTYMSIDTNEDHIFTLSGMDDEVRGSFKETHPEGTIITYECSGFTDKGVPRFGRYLRKRDDVIIKDHVDDPNSDVQLKKVIQIMSELGSHYKMNHDNNRSATYHKILKGLHTLQCDKDLSPENLTTIQGIGKGTIDKIQEILSSGSCLEYNKIKTNEYPIQEFLKIHGVGRTQAQKLIDIGFTKISELKNCSTIHDYLNDTQLKGLKYFDDIQQRIPYEEIIHHETYLKEILQKIDKNAELTIAGSYRRKKSNSGDIDLLLKSKTKKTYEQLIDTLIQEKYLIENLARGSKKYMGLGKIDISPCARRIDIMYTKPEEYPFAILYFTGSDDFNKRMRADALEKGYTMNEYSMKYTETKKKVDQSFESEKDIFQFLDYEYLEPELRIE